MVNEENLVATLEQSLRQTKNAQGRLMGRLREAEAEADNLRNEIEALENSAQKTKEAIDSILASMGSSNSSWKVSKKPQYEDDDYELEKESRRHNQITLRNQNNQNNQNNKGNQNNRNNRSNSVAYLNDPRSNRYGNVSSIKSGYEPKNNRFADRTITQACTLLLRDASEPLHVNELYNLLREGGFEFKGNNPTISIAVSLNRNRRFCKVAPGTFDLVMRDASQVAS
ncbi:MAG: winged helix-turn-helix domain-containing protein [Pyrinomonadaceae bacterium]|nr:winged helix-turn-helix domain-containing protein [Pyrinomonadaceae bacterium]